MTPADPAVIRRKLAVIVSNLQALESVSAMSLDRYWMFRKKEASPLTHSLTEPITPLGHALGVPRDLRKHLVSLTSDYTTARYPDAANGIPYEVYDRDTAEAKVAGAEAIVTWLRQQIHG